MTSLFNLPGILAFRTRSLRAHAGRGALLTGAICFAAGFVVFGLVRNSVYATLPDVQPESANPIFGTNLVQALLFALLIYIPAVIVLSNAISGYGLGLCISRQEYRAHGAVLLSIWGALFLLDAPIQYYAPHFVVIGVFGISVGMLALLLLLTIYTIWAVRQLNYLSTAQALGVFALSWFTLPVYYLLTNFLASIPFFILIPILYLGFQRLRGYFTGRAAEKEFQQSLQTLTLNPQNADAHYQIGLIHLRRRNPDLAGRYFENAIKIDAADPDYHYAMGQAWELAGEWRRALEEYEETYRLNPEYRLGDILREVGKAYLHNGEVGKGIEFLEFFLEKRGSDPEGRYWLAQALKKAGKPDQMRVHLKTILEQARSNPQFFRKEHREWIYRARNEVRSR